MSMWFAIWLLYLVSTATVFEILCFASPAWITVCYLRVAKFFLCLMLTCAIFDFTKYRIFKKEISIGGKAVFITGCDTGFGHHLAKQLDARGFHVFAGCLFPNEDGASKLKENCSERLRVVHVDVAKDESVDKAKQFVENNLGTCELWAVVNNAGIAKGFAVELTPMDIYREVLEVNALGPVRVSKAFLPLLRASKGRIVNINSLAGRLPSGYISPYVMSKFAAVAFTDCLSQEMNHWDVKVISIEPEFFRTNISDPLKNAAHLESVFHSADKKIQIAYGLKFLAKALLTNKKILEKISPRIDLVTNAIESAIVLQQPCPVYKPCASVIRQIYFYVAEHVPAVAFDFVVRNNRNSVFKALKSKSCTAQKIK